MNNPIRDRKLQHNFVTKFSNTTDYGFPLIAQQMLPGMRTAVIFATTFAVLMGAVAWYVLHLLEQRKVIKGLPQPPMLNQLMGHLYLADECRKVFPPNAHPHLWADYMRQKYDLPEVFYADMRPFGPLWMCIADPEMASHYVTSKQYLTESKLATDFVDELLGENDMVSIQGVHWKSSRSISKPGFSLPDVLTLTDIMVDACSKFCDVLKEKAKTNEHFRLEDYVTRLTIGIIGRATFDIDMNAQQTLHPISQYLGQRVELMPPEDAIFTWDSIDLMRSYKLWSNNLKLEAAVHKELDASIIRRARRNTEAARLGTAPHRSKSVIDLAIDAYEKEHNGNRPRGQEAIQILQPADLPAKLRKDLADRVKTFFLAGHDTTSSTIAWAYYLLHRNLKARSRLYAELDYHFPPETSAGEVIKSNPCIIDQLEYTTAFIKETMRIFTPASTLRSPFHDQSAGQDVVVNPRTGKKYPILPNSHIWAPAHLVHRNRRFFPQPTQLIPERFIQAETPFAETELFTPTGKDVFRAFEKVPGSCIGQELAMVEIKIILAMTAREFDFVLEYPGEEVDPQHTVPDSTAEEYDEKTPYGKLLHEGRVKRYRVEGHRCWPTSKGTAKPVGGLPGRVYIRS